MLTLGLISSLVLFVAVALLIYSVFRYPVQAEPPAHRRIAQALGEDEPTIFEHPVLGAPMGLFHGVVLRAGLPWLRGRIRQDLDASGNEDGYTVSQVLAIALAVGTCTAVIAGLLGEILVGGILAATLPGGFVLGCYGPIWSLRSGAQKRTTRIAKQLPYTLDLISLVMASGSSFDEAVRTLIRDHPDDDLNQELDIVLSEIAFGATRAQAMARLGERIPLETLRGVVGSIIQAESLGTPLSGILKVQSDMMRTQRSVRAEKLAASASLRILIPSMLILFAVVIVIFAPMVIRFVVQGSLF